MKTAFVNSYKDYQNIQTIHDTVNNGKWFQIGAISLFPFPLKRTEAPAIHTQQKQSLSSLVDREKNRFLLFVDKTESDQFAVSIGDSTGQYCYESGPGGFVTIQPLTESEAERVHNAAQAAFTVWYV